MIIPKLGFGQLYPRGQSATLARQHPQRAANVLEQAFDDGQAQPRAAHAGACRLATRERPQQSVDVFGRDARATVADFDHDHAAFGLQRHDKMGHAVAGPAIAAGVFDQVADHALQIQRRDPGAQPGFQRCLEFAAQRRGVAALAFVQFGQHGRDVRRQLRQRARRPRVFHQLPDAVVDLAQVFVNGLPRVFRHAAEFDLQSHAGKRGAQVVRDPRKHQLAIGLGLSQVLGHPVERGVQIADFQWTLLRQGGRRFTARQHLGRAREPRQGPVYEPHADRRADKGKQQRRGAPSQPFDPASQPDLLSLEHQPVQVFLNLEADPEAGYLVHPPGDLGFRAETRADVLGHALPVVVVGKGFGEVCDFARIDLDALVGGQVKQELAAFAVLRVDQRRARDIDGRDHPLRHLIGARSQLHAEKYL
ncbi:hypothetical protein D3C86_1265000 [compost metagenome]